METPSNNGGPAFPTTQTWVERWTDENGKPGSDQIQAILGGATLLDYFAAYALQGMLAYPGDESRGSWHNNSTPEMCAEKAYRYARAMIAERTKQK